jgi:hypothetical protein
MDEIIAMIRKNMPTPEVKQEQPTEEEKVFKFLVSRTLTSEIEVKADTLEEAMEQVVHDTKALHNHEFDDIHEETAEITAWPKGIDVDKWPGMLTF